MHKNYFPHLKILFIMTIVDTVIKIGDCETLRYQSCDLPKDHKNSFFRNQGTEKQ